MQLYLASNVAYVAHSIVHFIAESKLGQRLACIDAAAVSDKQKLIADMECEALESVGFNVQRISFGGKARDEIIKELESADGFFVAGGNTYALMQALMESGLDNYIRERLRGETYYIGASAGSIITGPTLNLVGDLDDKSEAPRLTEPYRGLSLVDFSVFPHWGSVFYIKRYESLIRNGYVEHHKILLITDEQYVAVNGSWYKIIEA